MGTQGPGRKRIPNLEKLTAEDDALNSIAREAEARLAAKRAARAEAREIRMKELERQQKEVSDDEEKLSVGSRGSLRPSDYSGVLGSGSRTSSRASSARASPVVEERPERDFIDKGSRTASTLSAATLASLGGASSRRGSCDTSFSVETEASIRDMKDSLAELEERYRRAMVSNAQLHNDKSTLMYQVETLKEELSDLEELLWEERRTCDERSKDLERQRQNNSVLQFQLGGATETLRRTEELLTDLSQLRLQSSSFSQQISDLQETLEWKHNRILEHGVVVSDDVTTNGETEQNDAEDDVSAQSASRLAEEASHGGRQSMMELRLKKLFEERQSLQDQVRLLKTQLDGRQSRGAAVVQDPEGDDPDLERGSDSHLVDLQSQSCSCWSPWAQVVRFWFWF
uniref:Leucine rich repeat (in FLII) interacting protein 1b n=1 Tax=Sphaeramia orbicularis TaxID=375764 RepID=A0A673AZ07_9TELE